MIKKTITYEDFEGNEITEDFWFHLSKAEILDLEMRTGEGFDAYAKKLIDAKDNATLIKLFKEILLMTFGVRDANNAKRFIKSPQLAQEFSETNAFSELYVELFSGENMLEFFKGVIPKMPDNKPGVPIGKVELPIKEDLAGLAPKFVDPKVETRISETIFGPSKDKRLSDYSQAEMLRLTPDEFQQAKQIESEYLSGIRH